jgi:hypothetical protein
MRTHWIKWMLVAVFACLSLNLTACDSRDKTKMPEPNPEAEAARQEITTPGGGVPVPPPSR